MVVASASGKAILFGEHAVVYGRPAIAMAIDKRVYVETNFAEEPKVFENKCSSLLCRDKPCTAKSQSNFTLDGSKEPKVFENKCSSLLCRDKPYTAISQSSFTLDGSKEPKVFENKCSSLLCRDKPYTAISQSSFTLDGSKEPKVFENKCSSLLCRDKPYTAISQSSFTLDGSKEPKVFENNQYIKESVNIVLKKAKEMGKNELKNCRIDIKTKSELPVSSGLGSSGALAVALIRSLSSLLDLDLDNEDIAKMGWEVERNVQGFASGIDPFVSTYGGIIYYKDGHFERLSIDDLPDLNFLIIHSGKNSATKKMVKKVADLQKEYPVTVNKIFDAIEAVTEEAVSILQHMKKDGRLKKLGNLMNINQGLLESLGVSTPELSNLFYESLKSGALGAKLTGSGGGGCLISLYPPEKDVSNLRFEAHENIRDVSNIFKDFVRLKCRISSNGVRIEE